MSNKLVVKQVYGLTANSRNSLSFSADHHLVYNSGAYVVVQHTESKEQNFISAYGSHVQNNKSLGCTAIATSLPKKFIAVAERGETNGLVVFYDSHSYRKKRVLNFPELGSKEYKCIAFSDDGRQCLTQGAGPDWNLVLWSVEKNIKAIAHVKVSLSDDNAVNQISFCPWDPTLAVVIGKGFVRMFRIIDGVMKSSPLPVRRENANFISHIWLPDDILLLGTEGGEILLVENNEYRGVIYPPQSPVSGTSVTSGIPGGSVASGAGGAANTGAAGAEEMTPVYCFCQTPRGFVAGTVDGDVRFFERTTETREMFALVETKTVPGGQGKVLAIVLDSDDTLICATEAQQLYSINLSSLSQAKGEGSDLNFQNFGCGLHAPNVRGEAAVTGIDLALWRPILGTTGKDKTLRLWNPAERRLEAQHVFEEEPSALAIHPSGLYAAVAFQEKVQMLSLLVDGFSHVRDINVRTVNIVKFSRGGQFLACGAGSVIQIYHTFSGSLYCSLRGHTNKIKSLTWLRGDTGLMSVGAEGASYFWEMHPTPSKHPGKHHSILSPFTCGATDQNGTTAFLASSERNIREVSYAKTIDPATGLEGAVREPRDVDVSKQLCQMLYDESRKIIIAATAEEDQPSQILTMSASPQLTAHNSEAVLVHSAQTSVMALSYDGSQVYSGDVNGCLVVCEFEGSQHSGFRHKETNAFAFQDEVAIRSDTLMSKKKQIAELSARVEELKLNNEHQLRLKEMDFKDRQKDIAEKFELQLRQEREKYDAVATDRRGAERSRETKTEEVRSSHSTELHNIEVKYKTKLNAESARYKALLSEVESTHRKWNEENAALVNSHQAYLKELCYQYEEKLAAEHTLQKQYLEEKAKIESSAEQRRDRIEVDGDDEVVEVKNRYEQRLKNEEETGVDLMAQHALVRKQLQNLNKDSEMQREEIKRLRDREMRLNGTIVSLEKDIQSHKKEIREREETNTDKEKRIFDLKKKNQELEKFRFVLDYKIRELKLQIEPREKETAALRRQSEEMALELEQYRKSGQALELMLNELRLKADGLRKELNFQEEREKANNRLLEKFKRDLRETWEVSNNPQAFKNKVVRMYRFYVQEDIAGGAAGAGGTDAPDASDPQEIYNRDREQLERSLESLRRALKTDAMAHKRDLGKMMREGVLLTGELNTMRKDARYLMLQQRAIEQAGGIGPKTDIPALMEALHIEVKKTEREKKAEQEAAAKAAKGGAQALPAAGPGTGAGAGVESATAAAAAPMLNPPSVPSSRQDRSRSSALRRTPATGGSYKAGGLGPEASRGYNNTTGGGDQWAAWKEIQMQNAQMSQLEDQLTAQCSSLGIDALHILVSIDANLNNGE